MNALNTIKKEIDFYENGMTELFDGHSFSAAKTIRRINLFKNQVYSRGKTDSQGNYKYWFDIISPRVDSEIKNIDFDTKDVMVYSAAMNDSAKVLLSNASLREFMRETGQSERMNEAIERGSEWGNVVWKKVSGGYALMDMANFMVINQRAETLEDSDVIEQCVMTAPDVRKRADVWKNTDELLNSAQAGFEKSIPELFIYERNGEMCEKDYMEAMGKTGGREDRYVLCKIVCGGTQKGNPTQVLFCSKIDQKPYKEYHRGKYSGRWLRKGIYETLFDVQQRCNEIGNQIARGLEWSSKTIFRSSDKLVAQNIITDLQNGDIIKSADLSQVETRMGGMDQLIADWNRLMAVADKLCNSYEVVTGEALPSGTPFALANQMNMNANKLFDFIREKLSIAFASVIEDWILPELMKTLKARDSIRLTGDSGYLQEYYAMVAEDWYINNLLTFGPHGPDQAKALKEAKLNELLESGDANVETGREIWENFKPRASVVITGENYNVVSELVTLQTFIALEQDPVRRSALIEMAMKKKNIDVSRLPKTEPQEAKQAVPQMQENQQTK